MLFFTLLFTQPQCVKPWVLSCVQKTLPNQCVGRRITLSLPQVSLYLIRHPLLSEFLQIYPWKYTEGNTCHLDVVRLVETKCGADMIHYSLCVSETVLFCFLSVWISLFYILLLFSLCVFVAYLVAYFCSFYNSGHLFLTLPLLLQVFKIYF